ncbi:MAG: oligosaccharide flippase family protein [Fibrobacter sp.]|nr:oligosaccharide flippase family protein [Fibrobacter sp.]
MPKSSHSLLLNFILTALAQIFGKGLRYVVASLVIMDLGAGAWGEISYALTVVTYLLFIIDFGIAPLSTVYKPNSQIQDQYFFHFLVPWRLFLSVVLALVVALVLRGQSSANMVLIIYLLALPLRSLAMEWWFQRKGFHGKYQMITIVRQALLTVLLLSGLIKSVEAFAIYDMLGEAIIAILAWILGPKISAEQKKVPAAKMLWLKTVIQPSSLLFVSTFFIMIHQNVAIIILKKMTDFVQVGIYDYSAKIVLAVIMLGSGFSIPLRRQMGILLRESSARIAKTIASVQGTLLVLSLLFATFSLFFAEKLFALIMPLENAHLSAQVLTVLAVYVSLAFLSIPLSEWIFAQSSKWPYFWLAIMAGTVNIFANIILIPHIGVVGSAWATVGAEFCILIYLSVFAFKRISYSSAKPALFVGLGFGALWWAQIQQLNVAVVLLGLGAYLALLVKLKIFDLNVLRHLRQS